MMIPASNRNNQLNLLARRAGYNLALRHFRTAQGFSGDVGEGFNLADVLNEALKDEKIQEFARSEHFEVYKKIFEELGIRD